MSSEEDKPYAWLIVIKYSFIIKGEIINADVQS